MLHAGALLPPTQCAVCRGWCTARFCRNCLARYAEPAARCRLCALRVPSGRCAACLREPPPFELTLAAADYRFPWDAQLAAFKFRNGLDRRASLAAMLADEVRRAAPPLPALLLPVPLSAERLAERGYNQAWELARHLGRRLGLPAAADVLRRLIDTPHQADLPRARRAANVRGSFGVHPRRAHRLRGERVALVDDVMTTGATAAEAARVLLAAGASAVQLWVVARTPAPEDI